jgi:hypothetical protein
MVDVAIGRNFVERSLRRARDDRFGSDHYGKSHQRRRCHQVRQRQHIAGSSGSGSNHLSVADLGFAHGRAIGDHCSHGIWNEQHHRHMVDVAIGRNFVERSLHRARDDRFGSDHYGKSHQPGRWHQVRQRRHFVGSTGSGSYHLDDAVFSFAAGRTVGYICRYG